MPRRQLSRKPEGTPISLYACGTNVLGLVSLPTAPFRKQGESGLRAFLTRSGRRDDQNFTYLQAEIQPFAMTIAGVFHGNGPKAE